MYQPKRYPKNDSEFIFEFIQQHPFATMVVKGKTLLATHIPFTVEGSASSFRLVGHVANHNKMLEFLKDDAEVLLIFQGDDGYVSSSWYKEKDISTWDYSAVHVHARLKMQSQQELEEALRQLVLKFEKTQKDPLYYKDIPSDILKNNLEQITGFCCEPFKTEGIAKYHQGFSSENVQRVANQLESNGDSSNQKLASKIKKYHDKNNQ